MIQPQTDTRAYQIVPGLRHWYNKLWLSEHLGYLCGPAGISPPVSAVYVIRPIINLVGMSAGTRKRWIFAGDVRSVEPGYFWCEEFSGKQISVDYQWEGKWVPVSGWEATIDENDPVMFKKWKRVFEYPEIGSFFDEIADHNITRLNIEFIGSNVIEVHLRPSSDPDYDELIPVWKDTEQNIEVFERLGYTFVEDYDDADGFISKPRIGFMVRNNKEK